MATVGKSALVLLYVFLATGCPADDAFTETGEDADTAYVDASPQDSDLYTNGDIQTGETDANGSRLNLTCGATPSTSLPFAAREVGVRITSPTGRGSTLYSGSTVTLAGLAFGDIQSLAWESGDNSGNIPVGAFWSAPGINLTPGDNTIKVVATGSDGTTSSDRVVVTSRTAAAQLGDIQLTTQPSSLLVNDITTVQLTISLPLGNIDSNQVNLLRVYPDGTETDPPESSIMRDDGATNGTGLCDAVPGDRTFSVCKTIAPTNPESVCYRVQIVGVAGGKTVESPTKCIRVANRITSSQCADTLNLLSRAKNTFGEQVDDEAGVAAALSLVNAEIPNGLVQSAGTAAEGLGIWFISKNQALSALPLGVPDGYRAAPESRRALLASTSDSNEMSILTSFIRADNCPPWAPDGPLYNAQAAVESFRQMTRYGVIAFSGHGGVFFDDKAPGAKHKGSQEVWWTGEPIECEQFLDSPAACDSDTPCPSGSICVGAGDAPGTCQNLNQVDLSTGRLAMSDSVYGITPAFVDHYTQSGLLGALIYASACHTAYNGSMAMSLLANGAATYLGFDGLLRNAFADAVSQRLFGSLIDEGATAGQAMCFTADPGRPETQTRLFGTTATSLDASGIINSGFEQLGAAGWSMTGNVRQASSFCGLSAQFGSVMNVASTGVGGAGVTGQFQQTLCIPEGTNNLRFWWRYLTSEPEALCGGEKYADRWRISLSRPDGTDVELKACTRDDLCDYDVGLCQPKPCAPPSDCGCGACYVNTQPLPECSFDGQSVSSTDFIQETFNVSAFAGGPPVTLKFEIAGDSLNPSALLVDEITFQ
ncbi:MAG: hypothetical protein VX223_18795 [Myxococcota bacterium]|nr:hypothetical protein [Myxococcota bacterium]